MNVEVKMTEPVTVAFKQMSGAYSQIPEALKSLYVWAATHFMQPAGMPSAVYYTAPEETAEEDARWEVYTPLARDSKPRDPDKKGCGVKHVGTHLVAATMHKGPYDEVSDTYLALAAWVEDNGYRMAGPPEESYLSNPKDTAPEDYLTEIRFPITKA